MIEAYRQCINRQNILEITLVLSKVDTRYTYFPAELETWGIWFKKNKPERICFSDGFDKQILPPHYFKNHFELELKNGVVLTKPCVKIKITTGVPIIKYFENSEDAEEYYYDLVYQFGDKFVEL